VQICAPAAPRLARPTALGHLLRRLPSLPSAVAALLDDHDDYLEFRRIVREIFPAAAFEILAAHGATALDREMARVQAFFSRVERDLFPAYEWDEYAQMCGGIPFVRFGWSLDDLHELDRPAGMLLMLALCEQPYGEPCDNHVPLLVACEEYVPKALLQEIPGRGIHPHTLHERLDTTRFAPAAEFADWVWSSTGSAFLDFSDENEIYDADWTTTNVALLVEQWRVAKGLLDRTKALAGWLDAEPPARFAQLLDAALGRDAHLIYLKERTHYGNEITEDGLAPVSTTSTAESDFPTAPPGQLPGDGDARQAGRATACAGAAKAAGAARPLPRGVAA